MVQRRLPLAVLPAVRLTNLRKLRLPAVLPINLRKPRLPAVRLTNNSN